MLISQYCELTLMIRECDDKITRSIWRVAVIAEYIVNKGLPMLL